MGAVGARPGSLPLGRRSVRARRRDLLVRVQPGGVHRPQHGRSDPQRCILRREHRDKVGDAYHLYRRKDDPAHPNGIEAKLFRRQYARETRIRFIGVWDTVGGLGIPAGIPWLPVTVGFINRRWAFHDTELSSSVDHAYQALAIDERRPQFTPTLWWQPDEDKARGQTLEQVWFAGVHTNVGGGYQDSGLSDVAFLWMKEKAEGCGLAFDPNYIAQNVRANHLGELRDSKVGLYRPFPDAIRSIGQVRDATKQRETNERVHPSAVERREQSRNPPYSPPNLNDYLERRRRGEVGRSETR